MTQFKRVDRDTMYTYLMTTPGLHNWNAPGMIGFSDSAGICRATITALRGTPTHYYLNVIDYRSFLSSGKDGKSRD